MLTCGTWVQRGVAKEIPDKVEVTTDELKEILQNTKEKIEDAEQICGIDLDDIQNNIVEQNEADDSDEEIKNEYGLQNYDEEGSLMTGAGMAGLMYYVSQDQDPYVNLKAMDEEDRDDFNIKKTDNIFVVGKMEEEYSCLEIYVYNEEEDSQYVHHDILLDAFPLCLEWLNYDPSLNGKPGNYIAVGTMEPDIQIWDLDVVDVMEPAFTLYGRKKKKTKNNMQDGSNGHTEAVLGLSWNNNIRNVLASGSADQTIKLWDMSQCTCAHTLIHHKDKVQSIQWHPHESQSLLSGSFDKTVVLVDCKSPHMFKSWSLSGECEKVLWDNRSPCNFFVSSDDGVVSYYDVRVDEPVFVLHAHEQAVTGMCLSTSISGCLVTVSADKKMKVWHTKDCKPTCVLSREMKMGSINFVTNSPDSNMLCAIGGEKDGLRILDVMQTHQGKEYFQDGDTPKIISDVAMETEGPVDALQTLTLNKTKPNEIIKKKKKKKK